MKKSAYYFHVVLLVCVLSGTASSHDFWLAPNDYQIKVNQRVDVSAYVGNDFAGESLLNVPDWYREFKVYQDNASMPVQGELGDDPTGHFSVQKNGLVTVGYQTIAEYAEIAPEKFAQYLAEEGLENALAYRKKNHLEKTAGKERYFRHAKTLLQAGKQVAKKIPETLGYALEIVLLQNPYGLVAPASVTVEVRYQGKPVQGLLLVAMSKQAPEQAQKLRTDINGKVEIRLKHQGPWLLKAVKIVKVADAKVDWESHWASLTFMMKE